MSEIVTNLFVYGTLMPGESNYSQIEDLVIDHKPGTIDGILVDLGAYPGLLPGRGIVQGVLVESEKATLDVTDRIEGYSPDRESCLYLRKEVVVRMGNRPDVVAWTYFFAKSETVADCPRLVVGEKSGVPVFAWRGDKQWAISKT